MNKRHNSRRYTIADVAKHAQVSIATVSRVLSKSAPVNEDTAARVWAAVSELNYRPQVAAQGLARQRTHVLGLALPEISGDFFAPLLRGIESAARETGMGLLIATSTDGLRFPYPLGEHNTDGLIVFTDSLPDAELRRLYQLNTPLVLLHRTPPEALPIPCVTFENKSGARRLVEHLIEVHRYRRIAFLRGPFGNEDSSWREMGYREALAAHGLPLDEAWVGAGGFDEAEAYRQIEDWLAAGQVPDAIFAGDDDAALGALLALHRAGKRIPEDVAVVGFDDVPVARHLMPALTTVRAPIEQAGQMAVRQLLRLIRNETVEPLVLLPTELVIRQSCGCDRKEALAQSV